MTGPVQGPIGAEPGVVVADEADHIAQTQSQTWTFITPQMKAAEEAAKLAEEQVKSGIPPENIPALKSVKNYPFPHPFMKYIRGIPMSELEDTEKPPMNMPLEAQQYMALHLERCGLSDWDELKALANADGFIHINQIRQRIIKHRAPEHGPNIAINPGTWHPMSAPEPESPPLETPDFTALTPEQLAAVEEGVKQAKIKSIQVAQADPQGQASAGVDPTTNDIPAQE